MTRPHPEVDAALTAAAATSSQSADRPAAVGTAAAALRRAGLPVTVASEHAAVCELCGARVLLLRRADRAVSATFPVEGLPAADGSGQLSVDRAAGTYRRVPLSDLEMMHPRTRAMLHRLHVCAGRIA